MNRTSLYPSRVANRLRFPIRGTSPRAQTSIGVEDFHLRVRILEVVGDEHVVHDVHALQCLSCFRHQHCQLLRSGLLMSIAMIFPREAFRSV